MKARFATLLSLLVVVALFLSACGAPATPVPATPAPATPAPTQAAAPTKAPQATTATTAAIKRGGVLKVGFEADFINLDPAHQEAWVDSFAPEFLYDTLLKWDPKTLVPGPWLAKSWKISEDGLTWTFSLRDDVKWHNGDPFVAADVKFTVERILNPDEGSTAKSYLEAIKSVEVIDDHTVALHLAQPFSPLASTLSFIPAIQNEKFVTANGGKTQRVAMGTGPFMFKEWIPDQVLRVVKNPNYWQMGEDGKPLPYLDEIDFIPTLDETARTADFLSGVTDMIELVPDKDVKKLQETKDVVMAGPGSMWWSFCAFNVSKAPFTDKRVRQAVAWTMDRKEISEVGLFNMVFPIYGGPLPDWHWASSGLKVYDHRDVEKAKALLAEAKYTPTDEITILAGAPYQSEVTLAEMTASYMNDIGMKAKVEVQEWGTFIENMTSGKATMFCTGMAPTGDPDDAYYQSFHTGGIYNGMSYSNPELDKLLEQGRTEADQAKRKAIYAQVDKILLDDMPQAFAILHQEWQALKPYVKNYYHMPNTKFFTMIYVWLDK